MKWNETKGQRRDSAQQDVWSRQTRHPTLNMLHFSQSQIQVEATTQEWISHMIPPADDYYKNQVKTKIP